MSSTKTKRSSKHRPKARVWFLVCITGIGLIAATGTIIIATNPFDRTTLKEAQHVDFHTQHSSKVPPFETEDTQSDAQVTIGPRLTPIGYPLGSVEDECRLNEFPPRPPRFDGKVEWEKFIVTRARHHAEMKSWDNSPWNDQGDFVVLDSPACWDALETLVGSFNPYLWGNSPRQQRQFAFFVLEEPLTFNRIFLDPAGDLVRVKEALSRPECLIEQSSAESWNLKESCAAHSLMNVAMFNRYCDQSAIEIWREQESFPEVERLTVAQDRYLWRQELEVAWVRKKCQQFDADLLLRDERDQKLFGVIASLRDPAETEKDHIELLIELAARLGDDAAGLTGLDRVFRNRHTENSLWVPDEFGLIHGRFWKVVTSDNWDAIIVRKQPPYWLRMLNMFQFLTELDTDQFTINWDWLVRHMCTPPYEDRFGFRLTDENNENLSCGSIVHTLKEQDILLLPKTENQHTKMSEIVSEFERVALELNVYD